MAQAWLLLADQAEKNATQAIGLGAALAPAQQQQQPQPKDDDT
jgi:hypothetical protein